MSFNDTDYDYHDDDEHGSSEDLDTLHQNENFDDNIGIAFLVVVLAGLSTAIGAAVVFFPRLVKLSSPRVLASGLGLSAGVMVFLSLVEIFPESYHRFALEGHEDGIDLLYACLSFFGGVVLMMLLDGLIRLLNPGGHAHAHQHEDEIEECDLVDECHEELCHKPAVTAPHCISCTDNPLGEMSRWHAKADQEIKRRSNPSQHTGDVTVMSVDAAVPTHDLVAKEELDLEMNDDMVCFGDCTCGHCPPQDQRHEHEHGHDKHELAHHDHDSVKSEHGSHHDHSSHYCDQEGGHEHGHIHDHGTAGKGDLKSEQSHHDHGSHAGDHDHSHHDQDGESHNKDRLSQSENKKSRKYDHSNSQDMHELFHTGLATALAIALHNFPEGLATFITAVENPGVGVILAIAIGMHNIPEGLCVALPIYYSTGQRWKAFLWGIVSGLSEPLGGLVGWIILQGTDFSNAVYGALFGLVAGMMVIISLKELLPTAHRYDPRDSVVTNSLVAGLVLIAFSLVLFETTGQHKHSVADSHDHA